MCITILVVGRASPRLLLVPTWEVSVYQSLADQKAARGLRAASSSIRGGWLSKSAELANGFLTRPFAFRPTIRGTGAKGRAATINSTPRTCVHLGSTLEQLRVGSGGQ